MRRRLQASAWLVVGAVCLALGGCFVRWGSRCTTRSLGAMRAKPQTSARRRFCSFHGKPLPHCTARAKPPGPPPVPRYCEFCGLKFDTCDQPGPYCGCDRKALYAALQPAAGSVQ